MTGWFTRGVPQVPPIISELGENTMPLTCKERIVTEEKHLSNHSERGTKQQSSDMQEAPVALSLFGTFGFCLAVQPGLWQSWHGAGCPLCSYQLPQTGRLAHPDCKVLSLTPLLTSSKPGAPTGKWLRCGQ